MSQKTHSKLAKGVKKQEASRKDEGPKTPVSPPQPEELSDADLEKISGGKSCASGQHLKEATITH